MPMRHLLFAMAGFGIRGSISRIDWADRLGGSIGRINWLDRINIGMPKAR
jgi:hypothetical protein